jgi:hypothetical protein
VQNLWSVIKRHLPSWPILCILGAWLLVVLTNYNPGTWLIGWDNLMPEFNFWLNIRRGFSPAWQEYQGLGLVTAMGHGATLPRDLLLWISSLVLPTSFVRYAGAFALLLIGPLGAYALSDELLDEYLDQSVSTRLRRTLALTVAWYYLFNLATVQYFYAYFETFAHFFGFIPWLLWGAITFLKTGSRQHAFRFLLISVLATAGFQVQTLLVVYAMVLSLFCLNAIVNQKNVGLKRAAIVVLLTFIANAFWFLPVAYFTVTEGEINVLAKQNQLGTTEVKLMNQYFGNLADIALLRGYWFEYGDYSHNSSEVFLMPVWREYYQSPFLFIFGYLLFGVVLFGIFSSAFNKKFTWKWSVIGSFALFFLMVSAGNGLLGIPFTLLSAAVPLFGQIFRTAFTKWSMVGGLFYALGLGFALATLTQYLRQTRRWLIYPLSGLCISLSLLLVWPIFQGQLLHDRLQLDLPPVYLRLFEFFQTQPKQSRVAFLPIHSVWSWNHYEWGYRGSGFLWYGIEQPILDRAFDMFSQADETFYHQASTAVYAQDSTQLAHVLKKYDISYLILDESVVSPVFASTLIEKHDPEHQKILYYSEMKQMLNALGAEVAWQDDWLTVYDLRQVHKIAPTFTGNTQPSTVTVGETLLTRVDQPYTATGPYVTPQISDLTQLSPVLFPWSNLTQEELSNVTQTENGLVITSPDQTNKPIQERRVTTPPLGEGTPYALPMSFFYADGILTIAFESVELSTANQVVSLKTPEPIKIATEKMYSGLFVLINGQYVIVEPNQVARLQVGSLKVGEPLSIEVFDRALAEIFPDKIILDGPELGRYDTGPTYWQEVTRTQQYTLSEVGTEFRLFIPSVNFDLLAEFTQLPVYNCQLDEQGSIKKDLQNSTLYLEADDKGTACMSQNLQITSTHLPYFLTISGEHHQGRNLKFFIANKYNERVDFEQLIPSSPYSKTYSLISWPLQPPSNYSLHLDVRSVSGEKSAHSVSELKLWPIGLPLNWLSSLMVTTDASPTVLPATTITHSQKIGTGFYSVRVEPATNTSLLQLSQAYNSGWLAFGKDASLIWKKLSHSKNSGWANAWLIPAGTKHIMIVFWPQLLSIAGFVVLGTTLIGLGLASRKK